MVPRVAKRQEFSIMLRIREGNEMSFRREDEIRMRIGLFSIRCLPSRTSGVAVLDVYQFNKAFSKTNNLP